MQEHIVGIGHNGPPAHVVGPPWLRSAEARVFRREQPVTTADRARTNEWILRFKRRTPPFVEPPMGWTGGEDIPSAEVELAFSSLSEAIGYAERQGLTYHISASAEPQTKPRAECLYPVRERQPSDGSAGSSWAEVGRVIWLDSKHLDHGQCTDPVLPDLEQALVSPATVFDKPEEVVRHPLLSYNCKREILLRWAWDEHLIEIAQDEGMPAQSSSRLDEVKAALLLLGEDWHPHPAAPAAFAIRIEQAEPALAA